jgi:hypothetical protein
MKAAERELPGDRTEGEADAWADGPSPVSASEQARRLWLFCEAYGRAADERLIDAIIGAVTANTERLRADRRVADIEWWQAQLGWLERHRGDLSS